MMRVLIPAHARRMMLREARRSADGKETGGILLGFEGAGDQRCWVTQVGDPGPRAERSAVRFCRDLEHAERLAEAAYGIDGSQWIGDWHTHPGGPPRLSPTDLRSYRAVLAESDLEAFLAVLLLPGDRGWNGPDMYGWQVTPRKVRSARIVDLLGA
jgi:integrative and conjugative element protein (TIGR02256 family)